jgi:DNA repair exonuclease SbcCD ATPase subunit
MKKFGVFAGLFALVCMMAACGGKTESNPEADSLRTELRAQMEEMDEMNLFLDAVNISMDSVVDMEGSVLRTSGESSLSRKEQIKQNMEAYKLILQQQRERLDILEKKLKDSNAYSGKMQKTIAALKKQLEEKDEAIAKLSEELEMRNYEIGELKENVNQLNTQVADLEEDTKAKEQEINEKTNQMNEAYVFIGDKSALKAAGLAQGGSLFKKLKLDASNIDKKLFQKIDIREVTTFQIPDDEAEVLSQMPAGSYKITKTGNDASVLTITNPDRFWSVSKYLIIKY